MFDQLTAFTQIALPKRALTELMGRIARARLGWFTTLMIRLFVRRFGVNLAEALLPDATSYACFNDFFARALQPDARPIDGAGYVCPVDGRISQFGAIADGQIYQAKGHHFTATALLGGDAQLAARFNNGSFANLYLSPKDYHRLHMPCDGRLISMTYVPGALYSVSPACARTIPGLFARNERVVCVFETDHGPMAMVLVGATIVGSVATVWHGLVNAPRPNTLRMWTYDDQSIVLRKGEEMGRFLLGSTVILLFEKNGLQFNPAWRAAGPVRLGTMLAQ
ncbi:archaetidylserine decarboxylase [Novosphingobium sp.]|uniref:archaetidylserine decarboxylase n=1 Tax=Novosphingobium sp. TaxID=1874826 RepID=UPI003341A3A4